MQSSTYRLFAWAIENRVALLCRYQGHRREIRPIILGHSDGGEKVLVLQTGGSTSKGAVRKPDWKCFSLSEVADVQLHEGVWQTGERHQQAQSCVKTVDYDANLQSPYGPRHSLGELRGKPLESI
jgi:hypothetical protein